MDDSLVGKYPWCTFLRDLEMQGREIALLSLYRMTPRADECKAFDPKEDASRKVTAPAYSSIDAFLSLDNYRISPGEELSTSSDVVTEFLIEDEEDDIVTEELAQIYLEQGDKERALEIYRKLSLRDKENFAYFAEQIENLEKIKI